MTTLKQEFQNLAADLFNVFESVALEVTFATPAELNPLDGTEVTPAVTETVEVQRPRLNEQARVALGLATTDTVYVARQASFSSLVPTANLTTAGNLTVTSVRSDPAGAVFIMGLAGG